MALFAISFYPCRTTVLEPEPLALVLFLQIFLENWLVLSDKNVTLQEFLLSASTTLGQHTPAGHYPIISSEHNHCRDSLRYTWEPGNCFAGCCVKLISKVQLETLMDLLPLRFSQLILRTRSTSGPCFLCWFLQNEVPDPVFN